MPVTDVGNTIGALHCGLAISLFLFGVVTLQVYFYFEHYPEDVRTLKAMVIVLWIAEALHISLFFHAVYVITINDFLSTTAMTLANPPWSLKLMLVSSAVMDVIVEGYLTYRLRVISKRWEIPVTCISLMTLRVVAVTLATRLIFRKGLDTFVHNNKVILGLSIGALSAVDFVVAASMIYWLSKNKSGFPDSDRIIDRLNEFAIESGLLTFCLGVSTLLTALLMPGNYIWIAILSVHSKAYSNTLLLSLNRRQGYKQSQGNGTTGLAKVTNLFKIRSSHWQKNESTSSSSKSPGSFLPVLEISQDRKDKRGSSFLASQLSPRSRSPGPFHPSAQVYRSV